MRITTFGAMVSVTAFLLAACSSAPADTGSTSSRQPSTKGTSSKTPSAPPSSNGSGSAGSGDTSTSSDPTSPPPSSSTADAQCKTKADAQTCGDCCATNHTKGADTFDQGYGDCFCAQTRCATACAQSACSTDQNAPPPQQGDACDTCLQKYSNQQGTGECDTAAETACKADTDCTAFVSCLDTCPQQ